jgi:hypothetical protein
VTRKPDHRGARRKPLKPSRRECRANPARPAVTMLVCFFISHARLRVRAAHPAFPAPSTGGRRLRQNSGVLRRGIADVWTCGRRLSDFTLIKWLPRCNDCCQTATPSEHLTLIPAHSRLCRFLATPLDESFLRRLKATAAREGEGEFLISRVLEEMPETGSRWTPRPASRRDYRAVT